MSPRLIDIDVVPGPNNQTGSQTLALTLIDTPALDFTDKIGSQQVVAEILRHVGAWFADTVLRVAQLSSGLDDTRR